MRAQHPESLHPVCEVPAQPTNASAFAVLASRALGRGRVRSGASSFLPLLEDRPQRVRGRRDRGRQDLNLGLDSKLAEREELAPVGRVHG